MTELKGSALPSSEQHIRTAEKWLREVENHRPTSYAAGLGFMAQIAQIHATLAVARAVREGLGG